MSQFQLFSAKQIEALRNGGAILAGCLEEVSQHALPGVTTKELDRIAEQFIRSHEGALPAFLGYNGYPATLCTSVNDACVHGLPGSRVLKDGDIVALDCGVIFGGLYTDACVTVGVGLLAEETKQFLAVSHGALDAACALVKPGTKIGNISSTIQHMVEGSGYSCVKMLTGHGLGTTLHQFPDVPNVGRAGTGPVLPAHTIIAIEPITSMGTDDIRELPDGWTIVTADGSFSGHFEHTVLVTEEGYKILA
ncbi:type I methionyl aminopeptidase [Candidatus Peregrinibacteria bacterium]|nr:type I methionyl aminopeptidase [Candidatus Peregrinibacteria bacterium]